MSGHSKWSSIKRSKGILDAKRGQLFTKLGREIAVAARDGADPNANARLRLAVQRARDSNMPVDTIERAIKRAAGGADGANYQDVTYEGYGPHGMAVLVSVLTDNRNRSAAEVRAAFTRAGGNLGESGSVRWLFDEKGVVTLKLGTADPDELSLLAIDAGADDVQHSDDMLDVYVEPAQMENLRRTFETSGLIVVNSEVSLIPKTTVQLDEEAAQQAMRLIDRLEELDDVQSVASNIEVSDEVAASLAG